jgi:hypothetical protein
MGLAIVLGLRLSKPPPILATSCRCCGGSGGGNVTARDGRMGLVQRADSDDDEVGDVTTGGGAVAAVTRRLAVFFWLGVRCLVAFLHIFTLHASRFYPNKIKNETNCDGQETLACTSTRARTRARTRTRT